MRSKSWRRTVVLGVICPPAAVLGQQKAFPEAEGFGQFATGGRTNRAAASVYHVTNLNDSGAGSFRNAVSQSNRFVVFDVGGIINLNSVVSVKSNITIAGQTAPGGITIYGDKVSFTSANNLISRYVAIRKGNAGDREDSASLARGTNMMFDHMSVTWGVDETFSMNPDSGHVIDNITIQNSIIAQGLDRLGHSAGGLMTLSEGRSFSILHSLFADNVTRNPKVRGNNEFINNVVYGWESAAYIMGDTVNATSNANVEGNYFIRGPQSASGPFNSGTSTFNIYGRDNDANANGVLDGTLVTSYPGANVVPTRHDFPTAAQFTAQEAVANVLANAGLSITLDAVDTRILAEVASYGTFGGVIQRETDLFPNFATDPKYVNARARLVDSDNDGMPDNWETARGFDPANGADWKTLGPDGYTRLGTYLNELAGPGEDTVWSANGGAWSTGANWSGGAPKISDQAFVHGRGAGTNGHVTIGGGNTFARRLFVGGNGAAAGERVTVTGGTLDVFDTLHVGHANHATLDVSGGVVSAGAVVLGGNAGGAAHTGTLNLTTGGTLQTGFTRHGLGGNASFNWNGGTIKAIANPNLEANATLGANGGTIDTNGYSGAFTGAIGGAGGLKKTGNGALALTNSGNTYTGPTTIAGGALIVSALSNGGAPSQLGASSSGAENLLLDGGTLRYTATSTTATTTDRLFTLISKGGTLDAGSVGQWRFLSTGTIATPGAGDRTLTLTGTTTLSDFVPSLGDPTGGGKTTLRKEGTGRWIFSTPAVPRSYSGDTIVNAGTLMTNNDNPLPFGAGKGNLVINAGTFEMNGRSLAINGLNGAGTLNQRGNNTTRTLTLGHGDAGGTFAGVLSDVPSTAGMAGAMNVIKTGTGTQTFSGANVYEGTTTINGGTLLVNGTHAGGGAYTVNAGGTLGGTGTIGSAITVNDGGTLAPGASAGVLTVAGATLAAGADFLIELNGAAAHDQLNVTGAVSVGGANLVAILNYVPQLGDALFFLNNDGADAIDGEFQGLPEGAVIGLLSSADQRRYLFQVSYAGNAELAAATGGNDVVLMAVVPEPAAGALGLLAVAGLLTRRRSRKA